MKGEIKLKESRVRFKRMTERAEEEIIQYLPVYSQPSERLLPEYDLQARKFTQPALQIDNAPSPQGKARKLPSILRYQSQKYLRQLEDRRVEEE